MILRIDQEHPEVSDEGIRIHYQIPTELHHRLKSEAALRGVTLKDFLIVTLEEAVKGFTSQANQLS